MTRVETDFSISKDFKGKLESLPLKRMKRKILGKRYELSLVFAGSKLSKSLHRKFHGKNTPANVLAFPLSKTSGEMFIDPKEAKKEAFKFGRTSKNFIGFLFIHGLLHLKGYAHGSKMETKESEFRALFNV